MFFLGCIGSHIDTYAILTLQNSNHFGQWRISEYQYPVYPGDILLLLGKLGKEASSGFLVIAKGLLRCHVDAPLAIMENNGTIIQIYRNGTRSIVRTDIEYGAFNLDTQVLINVNDKRASIVMSNLEQGLSR